MNMQATGLLAILVQSIAIAILCEQEYCNIVGNTFCSTLAIISWICLDVCKCRTEFNTHCTK